MSDAPVIRIVKKKHAPAAHHGGSWKVAYADFVTAMMAFFLVMWIISMDQSTRQDIQQYFNDPASASNSPAGISKLAAGGRSAIAAGPGGMFNEKSWRNQAKEAQRQRMKSVKKSLQDKIVRRPDLTKLGKHVAIDVTESGLVIELIETNEAMFFESGSASLPPATRTLLAVIAPELGRMPNPVVIEGHTDVVQYRDGSDYSNWELSADRANAARRAMAATGLHAGQVVQVSGYADNRLHDPKNPKDASNRRVTILVNYSEPTGGGGDAIGSPNRGDEKPFPLKIKPATDLAANAAGSPAPGAGG